MAAQSFAMGEAFGKGFQYGKRRISAMTNEEFNKMSAKDHFVETTADIKSMVPEMKASMSSFAFLQQDIIKELLGYIKQTAGTIIDDIQDTGTEAAQKAVDGIRTIVGLPPIYAKLVSPSGINALFNFWNVVGDTATVTSNKIFDLLKKIFGVNPPTNTVTDIFNWIKDNNITGYDPNLIGPSPPPGGVVPPADEPVFDEDLREPFAGWTGLPPCRFSSLGRKGGDSQILEYHRLVGRIKNFKLKYGSQVSQGIDTTATKAIILFEKQLLKDIICRYDMSPLVSHESL